ncbi:uncharacterized protein Dsimw501_GD26779, isoform B [Drosophila simulans]|uniref:Uncharacterized protein, isoform B n=1 Tax=Drosophila simulans TaxID=7240 RepID=A0A0J9RI03_DROSI|nr:uncharacterized protein Dsimw501_GD26779, isoform B [Drosophila simulans]
MTTENSATTVTTRMKWNLILKQAFDHRCCMLATFAIVAAADVDCNSVDVASERASLAFLPKFCVWEGRCCCCCCSYSKTTTTHPIKIVCNLQLYDCAERSTNPTVLAWTTKIKAEKQRGDRATDVM